MLTFYSMLCFVSVEAISVDYKRANISEIFHSLWIPPGQRKTAWPVGPRWSSRERSFELRSLSSQRQSRSHKRTPNVSTREVILLQSIHILSNLWQSLIPGISRLNLQLVPPLKLSEWILNSTCCHLVDPDSSLLLVFLQTICCITWARFSSSGETTGAVVGAARHTAKHPSNNKVTKSAVDIFLKCCLLSIHSPLINTGTTAWWKPNRRTQCPLAHSVKMHTQAPVPKGEGYSVFSCTLW